MLPLCRHRSWGGEAISDRALIIAATHSILGSPAVNVAYRWEARADVEELYGMATSVAARDAARHVMSDRQRRRFDALVAQRSAGVPLAQLRGYTEFCGLRLPVRRGVFTPRPSTEALAAHAIRRLRRRRRPIAIDVATGCGAVALAIARSVGDARVIGLDIDAEAVRAANANRRRLGLGNVRFLRSDGLAAAPRFAGEAVDVLTMHPPYVPRSHLRGLPREVLAHEPQTSLTDGSPDGLGLVRDVLTEHRAWIRPGGWVLIEIAADRSREAAHECSRFGLVTEVARRRRNDPTSIVCARRVAA